MAPDPNFDPVRVHPDIARLREGDGVRFTVRIEGIPREAFVVRWHGGLHAFLNTCRHQSLNLDFGDARFFDEGFDALVCVHHGARYHPADGRCLGGPCAGGRLTRLALEQRGRELWCVGPGR